MTVLLSEIVWEQIRTKWWLGVDIVIFDEFQFMSIKTGTGLSSMLREGRKFGLAVYLSSQFVGNYDVEEMDTLMQCGNILFFRPCSSRYQKNSRHDFTGKPYSLEKNIRRITGWRSNFKRSLHD